MIDWAGTGDCSVMRTARGALALAFGALLLSCRGQVDLGGGQESDGGTEAAATGSSRVQEDAGGGVVDASSPPPPSSVVVPCTVAGRTFGGLDGSIGTPVVMASLPAPSSLQIDSVNLYVASYELGPVYEVPLGGGQVVTLDAIGQNNVAINSTAVYTVAGGGGNVPQGIVAGCTKTGCGGNYTTLASGQTNVWGVAADDTNVYWTNGGGGAVAKVPVGGGAPVTLATGAAGEIIARGGIVFYGTINGGASGSLWSVPAAGGSPSLITNVEPMSLGAGDGYVFVGANGGDVLRIPVGGGVPSVIASSGTQAFTGIAADDTNVYWTDFDSGDVLTAPICGGAVVTLATGQKALTGIAVDANNVYWSARDDNAIMKLAK